MASELDQNIQIAVYFVTHQEPEEPLTSFVEYVITQELIDMTNKSEEKKKREMKFE